MLLTVKPAMIGNGCDVLVVIDWAPVDAAPPAARKPPIVARAGARVTAAAAEGFPCRRAASSLRGVVRDVTRVAVGQDHASAALWQEFELQRRAVRQPFGARQLDVGPR